MLQASSAKPIKTHQKCKECGHDGCVTEWEDGSSYCHSCKKGGRGKGLPPRSNDFTRQIISHRGIPDSVFRKYGVCTRVSPDGKPTAIEFPYNGHFIKVRSLSEKRFFSEGSSEEAYLFGMDRFPESCANDIIVTEGELDAMSAHAMLGLPAVSVRSSSSAFKDCSKARQYLNSFDNIYLCFDSDGPGQEALTKVATLWQANKVYHLKMDLKDANEYLQAGKQQEFKQLWKNARLYLPDGIVGTFSEIEKILSSSGSAPIGEYPFPTLNSAALGIRDSEVVLLTAQEGIGKTEIVRSIEHHILKTTDHNIGIIHLEEPDKRTIQGLIGYQIGEPVHFPDSPVSLEDQMSAYKDLCTRDGRVFLYPRFGSDDPNVILDTIRYLVTACDCKMVFLDHITMLVTGFEGDDERRKLDYLSTRMAMLVNELKFSLILVSHINDDGKTRGSRNISKIAHLHVQLDRDPEAATAEERNTTRLMIKKNRFGATTGPAGALFFDPGTFIVKEKELHKLEEELPF